MKFIVQPAEFLYLDLFPATLRLDNAQGELLGDTYKVTVTDNRFYAVRDSKNGPYIEYESALISFAGDVKSGYTIVTEDQTYYVIRTKNCGCGVSLRGVRLFPGLPYQRT